MDWTAPTLFYEKSPWIFLFITVIIGGGAAWMSGRAVAMGWKPYLTAAIYCVLLACALRFLQWSLFYGGTMHGSFFAVQYYLVDLLVLLAFAWLGYRLTLTTQMVTQYHWLYRRTSPLSWTAITTEPRG